MTTDIPCPRRDKWFRGCRFEPRYDKGVADIEKVSCRGVSPDVVLEALTPKTYVADICVVCGKVVDRGGAR